MGDLIVGLGLVLVIEGLVWALAPGLAVRLLATMAATPADTLRIAGAVAAVLGLFLVWLVRG